MNVCERCGLSLPKGSAHVSPDGCIESLREALEKATACLECGTPIRWPLHPACMGTAATRKGAAFAADAGRAVEYFKGLFRRGGPDAPQPEEPPRGKRWSG